MTGHRGRIRARAPRRTLLLLAALAALSLAGCRAAAPGWTFAPPVAGARTPSPVPSATPSPPVASPEPPGPTPWVPPTAAPSSGPVPAQVQRVVVPVLYYHRVIAPPRGFAGWPAARRQRFLVYDTLPAAFEAQLDWLVARGYTTILPRDLAAYWDAGVPLPERPVIITFDDGTHDWAKTVLPLLAGRHMIAEFYVTVAALHSGGMSWPELQALAAAGNGIGAHGLHHVQLAGFGGSRPAASEAVMRREVQRSRDVLAQNLGIVPDSYSYVGGGVDATLRRLVAEAGYTTARSIRRGSVQDGSQRFLLRVLRVGSRLDVRNVVRGTLVPGLPGFTRLMAGTGAGP